jgi:hypothetical protein
MFDEFRPKSINREEERLYGIDEVEKIKTEPASTSGS